MPDRVLSHCYGVCLGEAQKLLQGFALRYRVRELGIASRILVTGLYMSVYFLCKADPRSADLQRQLYRLEAMQDACSVPNASPLQSPQRISRILSYLCKRTIFLPVFGNKPPVNKVSPVKTAFWSPSWKKKQILSWV
jgi:hypothetical protein